MKNKPTKPCRKCGRPIINHGRRQYHPTCRPYKYPIEWYKNGWKDKPRVKPSEDHQHKNN